MILADRTQFALDAHACKTFNDAQDRPVHVKPEVVELIVGRDQRRCLSSR